VLLVVDYDMRLEDSAGFGGLTPRCREFFQSYWELYDHTGIYSDWCISVNRMSREAWRFEMAKTLFHEVLHHISNLYGALIWFADELSRHLESLGLLMASAVRERGTGL